MVMNASSSSGKRMAMLFVNAGAHVAVTDPDDISGQKVANDVCAGGGVAMFERCDPSNPGQVQSVTKAVSSRFHALDTVVNIVNLAPEQHGELFGDSAIFASSATAQLRNVSSCLTCQAAHMAENPLGGSIIVL
ncbi:hypothetical protein HDZ31DRAFT_70674 [Schizophyllum fasciatum]